MYIFFDAWAGIVGAVVRSRLSDPDKVRSSIPAGSVEIRIFVWPSFQPKLTQLSILLG